MLTPLNLPPFIRRDVKNPGVALARKDMRASPKVVVIIQPADRKIAA